MKGGKEKHFQQKSLSGASLQTDGARGALPDKCNQNG